MQVLDPKSNQSVQQIPNDYLSLTNRYLLLNTEFLNDSFLYGFDVIPLTPGLINISVGLFVSIIHYLLVLALFKITITKKAYFS